MHMHFTVSCTGLVQNQNATWDSKVYHKPELQWQQGLFAEYVPYHVQKDLSQVAA